MLWLWLKPAFVAFLVTVMRFRKRSNFREEGHSVWFTGQGVESIIIGKAQDRAVSGYIVSTAIIQ